MNLTKVSDITQSATAKNIQSSVFSENLLLAKVQKFLKSIYIQYHLYDCSDLIALV